MGGWQRKEGQKKAARTIKTGGGGEVPILRKREESYGIYNVNNHRGMAHEHGREKKISERVQEKSAKEGKRRDMPEIGARFIQERRGKQLGCTRGRGGARPVEDTEVRNR